MHRPSAAVLLLAGLVAADVVLVTGAVRSTHVDTSRLARSMDTETSNAAPAQTATAAETADSSGAGGKVVIAALSSASAWRATSRSVLCVPKSGTVRLQHSADGGSHWSSTKISMSTISGLSYAGNALVATGTDRSCKPAAYVLSTQRPPSSTTAQPTWTIDPTNPTKLRKSGKSVAEQPCTSGILDVATNSATDLAVLCGDHSVRHSTDAGRSWKKAGSGSGVLAIATGNDVIYAAAQAKCGITVAPTTKDTSTNCVAGTKDWSGPIDATIVGGTLWLTTGKDTVSTSVSDLG